MPSTEDDFRSRRTGKDTMVMVADISRAVVILAVAFCLLFGQMLKIEQVITVDPLLRYMFGGISLMYGSFRLYRGIKRDY
ncbi:hypothetical protein [Parasediminibacterium sp. JCM 36343]|uniref:hypothetical protein n=1 Tax=Parasediminibacterium sp. JCM 36343 TaxID=3374279 RepID=UPI00397DDB89